MQRISNYVMAMMLIALFIVPGAFIQAQQSGWWTRDSVNSRVYLFDNNYNVGIGTTTPGAKLEINNGSVLFRGTTGTTPVSGTGTRFMWIPAKSALRAGEAYGTTWDDANIGNRSVAMGYATIASGSSSTALGSNTTASGPSSTALGSNTIASAQYSTALGFHTIASGAQSNAIGYYTTASGNSSTALGYSTTASGYHSTAMGDYTAASGSISTAIGLYTTAASYADVAIGRYNVGGGTAGSWVATDPLFEIGNGSDATHLSNALTVLKNGKVGIGISTPQVKLDIAGGIRADSITITNGGADFVFEENYYLKPLHEVEKYIKANKHLPEIPEAEQMQKQGVSVGTLQTKLLQKIEELTLYAIEQNKRIQKLEDELRKK